MQQQFLKFGLIGLSIYLIATGVSYGAFTIMAPQSKQLPDTVNNPSTQKPQARFTVDPSIPRTEPCPLNGALYTKQEKEIWDTRRPLAVMLDNSVDARPHSGLSRADIVYEAIAEGGITRFMAVFHCGVSAQSMDLGPVRSARIYYIPWVLEYDALYNHVGGAGRCEDHSVDDRAKALCRIGQWKVKDLDQFGISVPTCIRRRERTGKLVDDEHSMVCVSDKLHQIGKNRGWTNVDENGTPWDKNFRQWKFKDAAPEQTNQSITYAASANTAANYGVRWEYNSQTNTYNRFTGGQPHKDLETDEQISPTVVVLQFAKYQILPDPAEVVHQHSYYENIGSGNALIFQDGQATEARWSKKDRTSRTIFTAVNGTEIQFNRGQIWIDMLPTGTNVTY